MTDRLHVLKEVARARVAAAPVPDQRYGLSVFLRRPLPDVRTLALSEARLPVDRRMTSGSLADVSEVLADVLAARVKHETPLAFHVQHAERVAILDILPNTTEELSLPHIAAAGQCQTLLIRVASGASLTVHETGMLTAADGTYGSALLLLEIGDDARLAWHTETLDHAHPMMREVVAHVHREGRIELAHAIVASSHVTERQHLVLDGEGARATSTAVMLGQGTDQHDLVMTAEHRGRTTTSQLTLKGAFGGRAQGVMRGLVKVHEGARGTDGDQRIHSLLLSDTAEVDAVPNLEIATDDVRCTHGATAGHLDAEQLFYLESRGLPRPTAIQLLVQGFLGDALSTFAQPDRERLEEKMNAVLRMPEAGGNT